MSKQEPLEALARAYDREDASQRGEPDPWKDAEDDAEWVSERLACAQVAEAAYLSAARSTVPAVVKPLAWKAKAIGNGELADSPCGRYEVGTVHGAYIAVVRIVRDGQWDDDVIADGLCAKAEAKAAAQADFESRILSALASVPAPGAELAERDPYEVANQLEGYVDDEVPQRLADFLLRESEAAKALADRIVAQREHIRKQAEDIMTLGKLVYASETETWKDQAADLRRNLEATREALHVIACGSGYEWSETREQLHRIIDASVECANNALRTLSEREGQE